MMPAPSALIECKASGQWVLTLADLKTGTCKTCGKSAYYNRKHR